MTTQKANLPLTEINLNSFRYVVQQIDISPTDVSKGIIVRNIHNIPTANFPSQNSNTNMKHHNSFSLLKMFSNPSTTGDGVHIGGKISMKNDF